MRIVSLHPTATEMAYALGLGRFVAGVSHECDFPAAAGRKPVISTSIIDPERMTSGEIDRAVRKASREGKSLYRIDRPALRRLKPDLLLTQSLCEVCASSPSDLRTVLGELKPRPRVLAQHAHDIEGMFADLRELAEATGTDSGPLEKSLRTRIAKVASRAMKLPRKRLFVMEWLDPIFASGHWVPEMVTIAGGVDALARPGKNSAVIEWAQLVDFAPEKLVLIPCGFDLKRTRREMGLVTGRPEWKKLPAVRDGEVYLADGHSYFNGAGPRLVDGIEILAEIIHPAIFPRRHRKGYEPWKPSRMT